MNIVRFALSLLAVIGAGCSSVPLATPTSMLPDCFDANYDAERDLFTIRSNAGDAANQQCLLTVSARGDLASASRLTSGSYRVYLSNGGSGGAGGSVEKFDGGGGGGGGGAGAEETQATVTLTEGLYRLTIGAGGPGGSVCLPLSGFDGGPGWAGSPSSMVRVATGEVIIGSLGADTYARPSRAQNEGMAGKRDAHGGFGPEQASGGRGGIAATRDTPEVRARPGDSDSPPGGTGVGGAPGPENATRSLAGGGGGGGATSIGHGGEGGGGGGEGHGRKDIPPVRGSLGSGGGGGEGSAFDCDPGARGGHGYIALRPR